MKKGILISAVLFVALSFMAFTYVKWGMPTNQNKTTPGCKSSVLTQDPLGLLRTVHKDYFTHHIAPRFATRVTKEQLHEASSIIELLPEKETSDIASYQTVRVVVLQEDDHLNNYREEIGQGEDLNTAQLQLLQSCDYSTNIRISAIHQRKSTYFEPLRRDSLVYYMTIVPEQAAEYPRGLQNLKDYLYVNSTEAFIGIQQDQLKPGKILFTVSKNGTVKDVQLSSTSGYPALDNTSLELIRNTPEKWIPATDEKGEKVDQELVYFFGLMGC